MSLITIKWIGLCIFLLTIIICFIIDKSIGCNICRNRINNEQKRSDMQCPKCKKEGQGYVALVDRKDRSKGKKWICRACGTETIIENKPC